MVAEADRIRRLAAARNRELKFEAAVELVMGILFSLLTFGVVFWLAWFSGWFVARSIGLTSIQLALIVTGVFFVVAFVSAWRRVDPLQDVKPMSELSETLLLASLASPEVLYFSPRHATAGAATLLIGGPAGIFGAIGTWRHRLRYDDTVVVAAEELLRSAENGVPLDRIQSPIAAMLLRRLALIKIRPRGDSDVVELTQKGQAMLAGRAPA